MEAHVELIDTALADIPADVLGQLKAGCTAVPQLEEAYVGRVDETAPWPDKHAFQVALHLRDPQQHRAACERFVRASGNLPAEFYFAFPDETCMPAIRRHGVPNL